jgi:hypothetical protein
MNKWLVPLLLAVLTSGLAAQSEAALKEYFEGKTVTSKLTLPGTEDGVDVYPGTARPLDYPKYADRLKDYGTAIRPGEPVTAGGSGRYGCRWKASASCSYPTCSRWRRRRRLSTSAAS